MHILFLDLKKLPLIVARHTPPLHMRMVSYARLEKVITPGRRATPFFRAKRRPCVSRIHHHTAPLPIHTSSFICCDAVSIHSVHLRASTFQFEPTFAYEFAARPDASTHLAFLFWGVELFRVFHSQHVRYTGSISIQCVIIKQDDILGFVPLR